MRQYEITNHLGNVITTISDKRNGSDPTKPDILTATDYYAFGAPQFPHNPSEANLIGGAYAEGN
jgi:hypothetical protein